MRCKIIGTVCLVLAIIVFVTTGTSFAYFTATGGTNTNAITGNVESFDVDLNVTSVYKATKLIPLEDSKVTTAITKSSNKCIDSKGYEVCSLYNVTLTNNGEAKILNGYINTTETTYTTNNLKCQLFDSNYTAVSDVMTLSNTSEKLYFKSGTNTVAASLNNKTLTYYLVIWLHETNASQNEDYSKTFAGTITFESLYGSKIYAEFSA